MRGAIGRFGPWERAVIILGMAAVVYAAVTAVPHVGQLVETQPRLIAAYLLALAAGELVRVQLPSGRVTAPVATASAVALAFTALTNGEAPFSTSTSAVVLVAVVGIGLGLAVRRLVGRPLGLYLSMARLLGASVVAVLTRAIAFGGESLWQWQVDLQRGTPLVALAMLAIAAVGINVELVLGGMVRAERHRAQWDTVLRDDLGEAPALNVALISSGPLVALLAPVLGLLALPLALVPMVLTYVAVEKYVANQATYRQMIATLSRLTEAGGYTSPDHAERVAELSVSIARNLGLLQRDVQVVEYAALLHDLGQIALREPIPGGATVLAAPGDQQQIAADGARIVRRAGVLDNVAALVEVQATPYRQVRELDEKVPVESRIIKVANAFDDLTGGSRDPDAEERALERIHLGLGYEYDPAIVEALTDVLRTRSRPSLLPRDG